jgi:hydrogenase maturation factor
VTQNISSPSCDSSEHCVTCSDAAQTLRVEAVSEDGAVAICVDSAGDRREILLTLVPGAVAGSYVLVHAGAALLLLDSPSGSA